MGEWVRSSRCRRSTGMDNTPLRPDEHRRNAFPRTVSGQCVSRQRAAPPPIVISVIEEANSIMVAVT